MHHPAQWIALIVCPLAALCTSCATLNENQCRTADWQQIGYSDGVKGHDSSRLADHGKSCAEYGITADAARWREGYAQGLGQYCTATNGYTQGRDGARYDDVCPPELDRAFRPAYEDGRRVASLRDTANNLDRRLRDIRSTLEDDDARGAVYLEAARNGRQPRDPPKLLGADERTRLEQEFNALRREQHDALQALQAADIPLSRRYGVVPLAY
jgi:hypothetical protein